MFAVRCIDVGKDYRLYDSPADRLWEALTRRPRHRLFTALRGVSFTVMPGESLGVVGRNGAGKSTLLKILTGTLRPTRGQVEVSGRVASLLELGAGFHPDLTGRQNIALNGALMGLTREELQQLQEPIIAFAELDEFIDRPVRSYSSGMVVRLAFAIATSVHPDILVIDEALAVGDLPFQRKCIERMQAFRRSGKTLIFCSHSMYHVQELCSKALWIHKGAVRRLGVASEVIQAYEAFCRQQGVDARRPREEQSAPKEPCSADGRDCRIRRVAVTSPKGEPLEHLEPLRGVVFVMEVEVLKDGARPHFGFALLEPDETIVAAAMTHQDGRCFGPFRAGQRLVVKMSVPELPLRQGVYRLTGAVAEETGLLWYEARHRTSVVVQQDKGLGTVAFRRHWFLEVHDDKGCGHEGLS